MTDTCGLIGDSSSRGGVRESCLWRCDESGWWCPCMIGVVSIVADATWCCEVVVVGGGGGFDVHTGSFSNG